MYDIKIGRFDADPQAQGVIRPADESWQLVIDKDGFPHLWLRGKLEQEKPDDPATGMMCVEDLLPDGCKVRDLMTASFGGRLTPEEEAAAHAEYLAEREKSGIPCPR